MSGIAKGAEIGVMRSHDEDRSTRFKQPMKLLHRADHVSHVFNHVNGPDLAKGTVYEREREVVQVRDHVGAGIWIPV